jgi:hypothetical protein
MWMKEKAEACGLAFDHDYIWQNIRPNTLGELRNSLTGLFKLLPSCPRPIGQSNETVDKTALDRMESDPGYRPANVIAYLQDRGEVRRKSRETIGSAYQRLLDGLMGLKQVLPRPRIPLWADSISAPHPCPSARRRSLAGLTNWQFARLARWLPRARIEEQTDRIGRRGRAR